MVSVDKKTKIFPAPKNEAAVKKETAPKKKDEASRRTRARQTQTYPRLRAARKLPTHPQFIVGAGAKKPVSKAYKDNWNANFREKEEETIIGSMEQV